MVPCSDGICDLTQTVLPPLQGMLMGGMPAAGMGTLGGMPNTGGLPLAVPSPGGSVPVSSSSQSLGGGSTFPGSSFSNGNLI